MKQLLVFSLLISGLLHLNSDAQKDQDKSKRPSPPATVTKKITSGATISIEYSQPSVKGRVIGKDLEPMEGQVWRTGANEATVFETNKEVGIEGKSLKAGKYGLFTIFNGKDVTIIFNKTWKQWGAFKYVAADDILRIKASAIELPELTEKLTFKIGEKGDIILLWGHKKVTFKID